MLVFQHGVGKGLLGFTDTSGVSPVIPLLLFVILFGLSMDYHVFIVSRIRERFQRGATMDEAISDGIRSTAGVVTSAAIVMVCVFAVFATLSMLFFKQFGVGLAAAILIDATIVRGVLLPATMKLLGERNWYLPAWLEWLPHFDDGELEIDDEPEPEPAPAARKPKRRIGAARITGLVLIVILALGLAYVKLASGGDKVSVPAGAKAGQLSLHPCHYGTEQGSYAADCGTLVVPENRAEPGSRLIALPVTRIRALSAHPGAPVFRLEGGPGRTNMHFSKASRLAENHDVVLVGYRGVDGSVRLDCPEVASALKRSTDLLGQKSFDAYAQGFRDCAARLQGDGVDLRRLLDPGPGRRPRDGAQGARLRADRPRQRERGHPHGDDLRLAVPEEHPPVGDDRRQPARPLPLGPEDDGRADPALLPALRAGLGLQQADGRPRGDRYARRQPTCPAASGASRSTRTPPASRPSTG